MGIEDDNEVAVIEGQITDLAADEKAAVNGLVPTVNGVESDWNEVPPSDIKSEDDSAITSSDSDQSGNSSSGENDESEFEEEPKPEPPKEEAAEDAKPSPDEKPKPQKKKRGRKRKAEAEVKSDSDSEAEAKPRKRGRRKKKAVELDENGDPIKRKQRRKVRRKPEKTKEEEPDTRHKLRKIIEVGSLAEDTVKAEQEEKERRQRLEDIDKEEHEKDKDADTQEELVLQHEPRVCVDGRIAKRLKDHQNHGIKFMYANLIERVERSNTSTGEGCILAHCMGLGKTIQALALLQAVLCSKDLKWCRTVLVLCPMNTLHNWLRELHEWLDDLKRPELNCYSLNDAPTPKERVSELQKWHQQGGIMVMGYDMYRILASGSRTRVAKYKKAQRMTLVDPGPDIMICDEGHLLKNSDAAIAKVLSTIKTRRRCVLTGTPLQNNLIEYHCMASFVKPNLLGTLKEFRNRFVNPILNGQHADSTSYDVTIMKRRAHVLHNLLSGCVQRKDYQVLAKHLPDKHEYIISVRLTAFQQELYKFYLDNVSNRGEKEVDHRGRGVSGLFADYQNLMRVWTHPKLLETHSLKREFADLFVEHEEAESEIEDMEKNINSADEQIAVLEDGDPGLDSTDDDKSDKFNFGEDAPLQYELEEIEEPKKKLSRAERRKKRNNDKLKGSDDEEIGEFQTLESAQRSKLEWWGKLSKDVDLNGLHHSSKIQVLLELLRVCEMRGEKLLVFSQSLMSLDLIEEFLAQCTSLVDQNLPSPAGSGKWVRNQDYFRMDGATSGNKRHEFIGHFNDPLNFKARLFIISTKAGCLGVNLVAATRVVIFDASWNPTHDIQSIFRVYRIGQNKPVFIYRLVAQGTMEEKVYRRQVQKQGLAQRVLDEQQVGRFFSQGDLKELYMFECEDTPEYEENGGKRFKKPKDDVFADLLFQGCWARRISKYHEHDSLLDHIKSEELSQEERAAAWAEYEAERTNGYNYHIQHQQAQQQLVLKQHREAERQRQILLKQASDQKRKKQVADMKKSISGAPATSSAASLNSLNALSQILGATQDFQNGLGQLNTIQQVLMQKHQELEQAKEEAEQAGAGDTSLDSMSTEDLVEKMASTSIYAALSRDELRKIASAALAETQKQRDCAQKKLQDAYSNYTVIQQTFNLQAMVILNSNPQLAPLFLSQMGATSNLAEESKTIPAKVIEQLMKAQQRK